MSAKQAVTVHDSQHVIPGGKPRPHIGAAGISQRLECAELYQQLSNAN